MRPAWKGLRSYRGKASLNPVILGRRFCPHCGRWRPVSDFSVDTDRARGKTRYRSYCGACSRQTGRELYHRMTPKQRERKREIQREANMFYRDRLRREAGRERRSHRRRSVVDVKERVFLAREPLLAEMERYLIEQRNNGRPNFSWKEMAVHLGVGERQLHRIRVGESRRVRIDVADRIAMAIGVPLSMIYVDGR